MIQQGEYTDISVLYSVLMVMGYQRCWERRLRGISLSQSNSVSKSGQIKIRVSYGFADAPRTNVTRIAQHGVIFIYWQARL